MIQSHSYRSHLERKTVKFSSVLRTIMKQTYFSEQPILMLFPVCPCLRGCDQSVRDPNRHKCDTARDFGRHKNTTLAVLMLSLSAGFSVTHNLTPPLILQEFTVELSRCPGQIIAVVFRERCDGTFERHETESAAASL